MGVLESIAAPLIGGAISGLLGADAKPSGSESSRTTENRRTRTSGTATETSTLFSDEELAVLRAFLPMLSGEAQQLTRAQALQDVQGFSDRAIRQLREVGIPTLFANQIQSGAFDQSAISLLGNDLTARTAESIAAAGVDAVTRYSGAQSDLFANISQIASLLRGAQATITRTARSTETVNASGTGSGSRSASSGQNPILAALAGGLNAIPAGAFSPPVSDTTPDRG